MQTFKVKSFQFYLVTIIAVCLVGCIDSLSNAKMEPTESIELQRLGVESHSDWVLSLGYALAHGFNDIHIENYRYRRVAREVVYIEPSTEQNKPRYLVTQSPTSIYDRISHFSILAKNKISVFDRKSGKTILQWAAPIDGWPGDKTAKRLAALMSVPKEPNLNSVKANNRASSKIEESVGFNELTTEELKYLTANSSCNGKLDLTFDDSLYLKSLVSSNWQLRLPRDFNSMLCTDEGVFISSAWQPEDLDLIWLSYDGKLEMSTYIKVQRTKLGGEHYPSTIVSAYSKGEDLIVRRAFFKQINSGNKWALDKEIEYTIPLINSNKRLNRTSQ